METSSPAASSKADVPTFSWEVEVMAKALHERARAVFGRDTLASCLGFNVHPGVGVRWQAFVSVLTRDPVIAYGDNPEEALRAAEREINLCSEDNIAAVLGIGRAS